MGFSEKTKKTDLEIIFKEYYAPLCKYAYSFIPNKELCEDLVQDIFLKIWKKTPNFTASISSYLYRSVKNSCINQMKKSVQQTLIPIEEIEDPIDSPFELNKEIHLEKVKLKVETAIQNLPPRCREIFIMRRNMKMSYDEISNSLNISKKTIENQMNSAIKKLRAQLNKTDLFIYFLLTGRKL